MHKVLKESEIGKRNDATVIEFLNDDEKREAQAREIAERHGFLQALGFTRKFADKLQPEAALLRDVKAMLTKRESGGCGKYIFEGRGNRLMHSFNRAASHYTYHSDLAMIEQSADYYADLAQRNRTRNGPLVVVELGGGGAKTLAFLRAVKPDIYIPVDYALEPLVEVADMVQKEFPDMIVNRAIGDFNTERMRVLDNSRVIVAQFGITLGNMKGFPGQPRPMDVFAAALSNYAHILQDPDDRLIVSLDHNHDSKTLDLNYSDPGHAELSMEFLDSIKRNLPVSHTFDPSNFKAVRYWVPESHLYVHGYEAVRDNTFNVEGAVTHWKEGEKIGHTNSYRFDQDAVDELAAMSGTTIERTIADDRGYIHHHIFAPGQNS